MKLIYYFLFHFYDQKYDKKQLTAAKADFVHGLR